MSSGLDSAALVKATVVGTILQLAMVVSGHNVPAVAELFAVLGVSISLLAGLLYAIIAGRGSVANGALGGALAGGICALIGIIVSYLLGDVLALLIAFGTISSAVTGAVGGALGRWIARRPRTA